LCRLGARMEISMKAPVFSLLAAAAAALVTAPPVPAQENAPAPVAQEQAAAEPGAGFPEGMLIEIVRDPLVVQPFNITVDELDGMMLFGSDGTQFGEIDAVLGNGSGEMVALLVEVSGFVGMGDRQVILPIGAVQPDGLRLTVDLTAQDMEQHPLWAD